MREIIVKKEHSKNCCIVGTQSEHYFPVFERSSGVVQEPFFFGNFVGNRKKGYHHWLEMRCNDTSCDFRAIINTNVISNLLKNLK